MKHFCVFSLLSILLSLSQMMHCQLDVLPATAEGTLEKKVLCSPLEKNDTLNTVNLITSKGLFNINYNIIESPSLSSSILLKRNQLGVA
jgi:hypothetical protein